MMVPDSLGTATVQLIVSRDAFGPLCQSFARLLSNPASLYLSATSQSLIIYVLPTHTVNVISLQYAAQALRQKDPSASALKAFLRAVQRSRSFLMRASQQKFSTIAVVLGCLLRLAAFLLAEEDGLTRISSLALNDYTCTKCR